MSIYNDPIDVRIERLTNDLTREDPHHSLPHTTVLTSDLKELLRELRHIDREMAIPFDPPVGELIDQYIGLTQTRDYEGITSISIKDLEKLIEAAT